MPTKIKPLTVSQRKMVEDNYYMVRPCAISLAKRYPKLSRGEIISVIEDHLLNAVRSYRKNCGTKFSTWAFRACKLWSRRDLLRIITLRERMCSLDAMKIPGSDSDTALTITDESILNPAAVTEQKNTLAEIQKILARENPRDQLIVKLRFQGWTLQEIGRDRRVNVSRERVRQIIQATLNRAKEHLQEKAKVQK